MKGKTVIIISYFKDDDDVYGELFKQLKNAEEEKLLSYLSYIIFDMTEDIYYRPSTIKVLSSKTKESMLGSFTSFLNPLKAYNLYTKNLLFAFDLFKLGIEE